MIRTKEDLQCKVLEFISNTEVFMVDFPEEPSALLRRAYSTLIVDYMSLFTAWNKLHNGNPNGGANGISILSIIKTLRQDHDYKLDVLKSTTSDWRGTQACTWMDVCEEVKKLNTYRINVCHGFSDVVEFRTTQSTQHVMAYLLYLLCTDIDMEISTKIINQTVEDLAVIMEATTKGI